MAHCFHHIYRYNDHCLTSQCLFPVMIEINNAIDVICGFTSESSLLCIRPDASVILTLISDARNYYS